MHTYQPKKCVTDDECLKQFHQKIAQHNLENPNGKQCIFPACPNKINVGWDNNVLCLEHKLMVDYWFYELNGHVYCPEVWDFDSEKRLPKPEGSDADMTAYRKRYCEWMAHLSAEEYRFILLNQIR